MSTLRQLSANQPDENAMKNIRDIERAAEGGWEKRNNRLGPFTSTSTVNVTLIPDREQRREGKKPRRR